MLHRSTHPTPLTLLSNVAIVAVVCFALFLTREPLVLFALFAIRDLPFMPGEVNVKLAELDALNNPDGPDDSEPYQGTSIGFGPKE